MRELDGLDAVLSGFFGSIGTNRSQTVDAAMMAKAKKALKLVGGSRLAKKDVSIMSMGEARRVLMARALVNEPEALILDEPMNNLDLTGKHAVRQAMTSIAKAGGTLVLVTQDPADVIPEMDPGHHDEGRQGVQGRRYGSAERGEPEQALQGAGAPGEAQTADIGPGHDMFVWMLFIYISLS